MKKLGPLTGLSGKAATIHLDELTETVEPPAERLHLVQGILKGAAMDPVIQKATELGATDLWLLDAARTNVALDRDRVERKREHWQRIIPSLRRSATSSICRACTDP